MITVNNGNFFDNSDCSGVVYESGTITVRNFTTTTTTTENSQNWVFIHGV